MTIFTGACFFSLHSAPTPPAAPDVVRVIRYTSRTLCSGDALAPPALYRMARTGSWRVSISFGHTGTPSVIDRERGDGTGHAAVTPWTARNGRVNYARFVTVNRARVRSPLGSENRCGDGRVSRRGVRAPRRPTATPAEPGGEEGDWPRTRGKNSPRGDDVPLTAGGRPSRDRNDARTTPPPGAAATATATAAAAAAPAAAATAAAAAPWPTSAARRGASRVYGAGRRPGAPWAAAAAVTGPRPLSRGGDGRGDEW